MSGSRDSHGKGLDNMKKRGPNIKFETPKNNYNQSWDQY